MCSHKNEEPLYTFIMRTAAGVAATALVLVRRTASNGLGLRGAEWKLIKSACNIVKELYDASQDPVSCQRPDMLY